MKLASKEQRYVFKEHASKKTRGDTIQNTTVKEILKFNKTQVETKIRWYAYIKRMKTGRIPRQALEYQLGGKRPRGQLRYIWEGQIKKNVKKRGIKWIGMMREEITIIDSQNILELQD